MSLSRIYRDLQAHQVQRVTLQDLAAVTEKKEGGFVPLEGPAEMVTSPATASPSQEAAPKDAAAETAKSEASAATPDAAASEEAASPQESATATEPEGAATPQVDIEAERAEAYEAGRQDAEAALRDQLGQATSALLQACEQLEGIRKQHLQRSSDDMLELALAVAQRIVGAHAASHSDIILKSIQQALEAMVDSDQVRVYINPDDLQHVEENKPLLLARMDTLQHIELDPYEKVSPGGCVVESEVGRVDATIETQLAEMQSRLQHALRQQADEEAGSAD